MPTITYVGLEEPNAKVDWTPEGATQPVRFVLNRPVHIDLKKHGHAWLLEKARGNPAFEVDDDAEPIEDAEVVSETLQGMDDYVPVDDEAEKAELRQRLTDLGINVGGRAGVEFMRKKLAEVGG